MKKAGIILLLLLYACTQFSAALLDCYKPLLHAVSKLKWELRSSHHFTTVTLHSNTYRQLLQEDNELWWQGSLHDIETFMIKGDSVQLLLEKDADETIGIANIEANKKLLRQTKNAEKRTAELNAKWITELFNFPTQKISNSTLYSLKRTYTFYSPLFFKNPFIARIAHPPDTADAFFS